MSAVVLPFAVSNNDRSQTGRGFRSFKCTSAIQYTQRCTRDALIQASLDPAITAIEPAGDIDNTPADTYFSFAVITQGRRCAIALTELTSRVFQPSGKYQVGLAIDRSSVLADPVRTTARMIWACREVNLPPLFPVRVLRRLKAYPEGLRLGDLEEELVDEPQRWVDYTLALACAGLVFIDCRSPITDDTIVRTNPAPANWSKFHWQG